MSKLDGKRIFVTTIGLPHPTRGASIVLFFHYIKALLDNGARIFHVVIDTGNTSLEEAVSAYVQSTGHPEEIEVKIVKSSAMLLPDGFDVHVNMPDVTSLMEQVQDFQPTCGLAFDVAAGSVLNKFPLRFKTIWLGDLLFNSNWYGYLYSFREDFKTLRWLPYALFQTRRWKQLYREILSEYDDVVVSSHSSIAHLKKLGISSRFAPYPWPDGQLVTGKNLPEKPTFLFFGALVGLGSRSSMHFLLKKVYPLLVQKWGEDGFEIIIGGREKPRDWMVKEFSQRQAIRYVGFIEDLAQCIRQCHAVITPLDVPVGNRSRILTAWSMGALVITHKNAALGNPSIVDGETAYTAATPEEFTEKMVLSVEKPEKSKLIVDLARDRYLKEYSLEKAAPLFVDVFSEFAV